MADNVQSQLTLIPSSTNVSRGSNVSEVRYPPGILMTHSTALPHSASPTIITRGINFGARTAEQTRVFANTISSAIEEIEPLIEQARLRSSVSLGSLLNIQRSQTQTRIPTTQSETAISTISPDNYVINVEDSPTSIEADQQGQAQDHYHHHHHHHHHHHEMTIINNPLNTILEADRDAATRVQNGNSTSTPSNNDDNTDNNSTGTPIRSETVAILEVYGRFIPFVVILVAKSLYDYGVVLLNFLVIMFTFDYANTVVKREIARQQYRSWASLLITTCYIIACIVFIAFEFDIHIFSPYTESLTLGELLCSVFVTDYVLKLITIIIKIAFTCLPARLVALRKRGKYYLMIEATSQLYRAIMPIGPWLYYLFEAYQGTEKVVGIFLSVAYTASKGNDLLSNVKLFHKAVRKMLQDERIGVSPSKEQIIDSGGTCTICHEEYSIPVRLHCTHIFCEACVTTWLDRERSCPLCRAAITEQPIYRDGETTGFIQFY